MAIELEKIIPGDGAQESADKVYNNDNALLGEINKKVDKVEGKGLSTNDYTTSEKDKLKDLPTNEALKEFLDSKADFTNPEGNEVVYAPNGEIEISEDIVTAEYGEKADYTLTDLRQYVRLNTSLHGGNGSIIAESGSESLVMIPLSPNETYYISLGEPAANWPYHLYRSPNDATSYFKQDIGLGVEFATDAGTNYLSFAFKWSVNDRTNSVLIKGKLGIASNVVQDGILLNILNKQYDLSEIRGTAMLNESVVLPDMSGYIKTGNKYLNTAGVISDTTDNVTMLLNYPIPANTNIDVSGFVGNVAGARVFIKEADSGNILVDLLDSNASLSSFKYSIDVLFSTHLSITNTSGVNYYNIKDTLKFEAKYRGKGLRYSDGEFVLLDSLRLAKKVIQADSIPLTLLQDTTFLESGVGGREEGTVSIFQPLERGTTYELDFGRKVGFGIQIYVHLKNSIGGIGQVAYDSIPAGGLAEMPVRRKIRFKTLEIDTNLAMVVKLNVAGANYDISDKVKLKKLTTEELISNNIVLSQKIDLSNQNDIIIPKKPEKVYINFIGEWNKVTTERYMLWMEYFDSNGFYFKKKADTAWQGASSLKGLAKNHKLNLYNSDGSKCYVTIGEWFARKGFTIKVDWVDPSHVRNIGSLKIVDTIYNRHSFTERYPYRKAYSKMDSDIAGRYGSKAKFHDDGIPCVITHNSGFYSLGTLNNNTSLESYMVDKNSAESFVFVGKEGATFAASNLNKVPFEELKTGTEGVGISDETFKPMADLITWLNSVNTANFKLGFTDHFDLDNALDFYLMMFFGGYWDQVHNNITLVTYDSKIFRFYWYDCDVCFDSVIGGVWVELGDDPNYTLPNIRSSKIWSKFQVAFADEIKTRYAELRKLGIFTVENVEKQFGSINDAFTYEERLNDLTAWFNRPLNTSVGNTGFTGMSQILDWTQKRIVFLDNRFGYNS